MLDWLKTKLHEKKVKDRAHKHLATASGPSLHRLAIAVAMSALEEDLVQEEVSKVKADQKEVVMMTYECLVMWAILNGLASAHIPESMLDDVVTSMRDHFAEHASFTPDDFEKLWDKTQFWMPQFAKPSKDGNYWPVTAFVQIPHAAGLQLDFRPSMAFGYHFINILASMTDVGKFAAEQELAQQAPKPGSALEAAREASKILIVSGYRRVAAHYGCPPSSMTSDEQIMEIYSRVGTAFQQAAKQRGEIIPAEFINRIVLEFLFFHEKMPAFFFDEHLRYEIEKYVKEGLRPDYKEALPLF
jgi:hypothetical protein